MWLKCNLPSVGSLKKDNFSIWRIMKNVGKTKAEAKYLDKSLTLEILDRFTFIIHICNQNDKFLLTVPFVNQLHEKNKKSVWSIDTLSNSWNDYWARGDNTDIQNTVKPL